MRKVTLVTPILPVMPKKKRVCAYTRVSLGNDAMLHSLSAQVSYYSSYIQNRADWEYCGVYTDEAVTGTKDTRDEFQRMIQDCRNGKIDMVITKSISRFARNTVALLETVRELKELGINCYFERENIYLMSGDGELMLTILASYAQEESRSASENIKWRKRKGYEQGNHSVGFTIYGYDYVNGDGLKVNAEEAVIIRRIYADYLSGMGSRAIAKKLNDEGVQTKKNVRCSHSCIERILSNEKYIGDMLLQKGYVKDHLNKEQVKNKGELPQFLVSDSHEAIISREMFQRVRDEQKRRAEFYKPEKQRKKPQSAFTRKIFCQECGRTLSRQKNEDGNITWVCQTNTHQSKKVCPSKPLSDYSLRDITQEVLGKTEITKRNVQNLIEKIIAPADIKSLEFLFYDGNSQVMEVKEYGNSDLYPGKGGGYSCEG